MRAIIVLNWAVFSVEGLYGPPRGNLKQCSIAHTLLWVAPLAWAGTCLSGQGMPILASCVSWCLSRKSTQAVGEWRRQNEKTLLRDSSLFFILVKECSPVCAMMLIPKLFIKILVEESLETPPLLEPQFLVRTQRRIWGLTHQEGLLKIRKERTRKMPQGEVCQAKGGQVF